MSHDQCGTLEFMDGQRMSVCICKKCGVVIVPMAVRDSEGRHLCYRCADEATVANLTTWIPAGAVKNLW